MVACRNVLNYWQHGARPRAGVVHPRRSFTRDIIRDWNRLRARGFTQYQVVLPGPSAHARHLRFVRALRANGGAVFLCVIKDCGAEGKGMLSFPKPGVSYALDIPIGPDTQALVDALNEIAAAERGRIYLPGTFTRAGISALEPRLDAWNAVRRA
jgi:hypothetical protein